MESLFDRLEEHGLGPERRIERVPVDDIREALSKFRRLVILGEPGAGKTTTLRRIHYDLAQSALQDSEAPLPVLVPLKDYEGSEPPHVFVVQHIGELGLFLPTYLARGRVVLLLDGLNEMPRADYAERVRRIRRFLDEFKDASVAVTCRALDYDEGLNLEKLEIKPLDVARQREYVHKYLGSEQGERLLVSMAGGEAGLINAEAGRKMTPLLALGANPFSLRMVVQVFRNKEVLPANRAKLLDAYVDILLEREGIRHEKDADWPDTDAVKNELAKLAFGTQIAAYQSAMQLRKEVLRYLSSVGPNAIYTGRSAGLLDLLEPPAFSHQLFQEYFAAREWRTRVLHGEDLSAYWPGGWLTPSGWEETTTILANMLPDPIPFLEKLLPINPGLVIHYIAESRYDLSQSQFADRVQKTLVGIATNPAIALKERDAAGNWLNMLGDPRAGVGLDIENLPDIAWCEIPAGPFLMGSSLVSDSLAKRFEAPQHTVLLDTYFISRYLITNAQYQTFVRDGGYTKKWMDCWTHSPWILESNTKLPISYGGNFDLPNHPVVGVTWHEALAFCNWLQKKLGRKVSLPTEAQWEKAARGTDARIFPWIIDLPDEQLLNYGRTGIGSTTAVGIFPSGESPYKVADMAGNVWEWTSSEFVDYPYNQTDGREDIDSPERRVLRGGAYNMLANAVRCSTRAGEVKGYRSEDIGFRIVMEVCESDL